MRPLPKSRKTIALFGHFDSTNLGNEATLQAILHHLRRFQPEAEFICISTGRPASTATKTLTYIPMHETFRISDTFANFWSKNPFVRVMRKLCIGGPAEVYRWIKGLGSLRRADVLIVPGTGLLTDAGGLRNYAGPYNVFKWSMIAKCCRCKLLFVSVGAGPLYNALGRWFVKSALSLADFRSYREHSSSEYLKQIGFHADHDPVYPDLAFSLSETLIPTKHTKAGGRPVVGLGLMSDSGTYRTPTPSAVTHQTYLETLATLAKWLLAHDYDIRLFTGDIAGDVDMTREFTGLLTKGLSAEDEGRVIEEPVGSVDDLLSQIARTDFVVATRFHNVVLSLLSNKPVISISFHHKCDSLMSAMGLSMYCLQIDGLTSDVLIDRFCDLTKNAKALRSPIGERTREFRKALDEQYAVIFSYV